MPRIQTAKLFMNGRSQAVRLPQEFRFEGEEVRIHREGNRVILEPVTTETAEEWFARLDALRVDEDFPEDFERPGPDDYDRRDEIE